ncbi:MAG: arginine--tRNA ligase [Bacteroidota bacterium]|nr:arginine--tRNA ligase [Bacteroidota bacterium]MDP4231042.1 arginine--tRNA ligase [Bacteroidota bacterium]MDP4234988.1 arginine--tRNA ligase [Bacteroidota bacterium]
MEEYLKPIFSESILAMAPEFSGAILFETPQNPDHGDLSTNIAMLLAKEFKKAPRIVANEIVGKLRKDPDIIDAVEIAGPGFINIRFSRKYFHDALGKMLSLGSAYGHSTKNTGKTVNLEWVSANPTGNLHAGHGRQVCLGAAIANLLEWTGYKVVREYYFNNAGNQMRNLARSTQVRYLQELGQKIDLPEDGYHGAEIVDIARELVEKFGNSLVNAEQSDFQKFAEEANFRRIKNTLHRLGVQHDLYFNENTLYESGAIEKIISELKEKGLAYEKDGALWLKLSEMGQDQDRVIVKSTGEPTYRLPDICYHKDKLSRGYDFIIDIFGADHIATIPDVLATVKALGFDSEKVKVIIHQMVTFISGNEVIKFSKRSGSNYLLDELIDDVGTDATKFFFNMRAAGSHLEFDVELAKEQSEKNPVYYVQYAHARIASILRFAAQQEINIESLAKSDLTSLEHVEEIALIKILRRFPGLVMQTAEAFAPHHICEYLRQVAAQFHKFYHDCRIVGQPEPVQSARLALALATKQVLAGGCSILGVTAPESM